MVRATERNSCRFPRAQTSTGVTTSASFAVWTPPTTAGASGTCSLSLASTGGPTLGIWLPRGPRGRASHTGGQARVRAGATRTPDWFDSSSGQTRRISPATRCREKRSSRKAPCAHSEYKGRTIDAVPFTAANRYRQYSSQRARASAIERSISATVSTDAAAHEPPDDALRTGRTSPWTSRRFHVQSMGGDVLWGLTAETSLRSASPQPFRPGVRIAPGPRPNLRRLRQQC